MAALSLLLTACGGGEAPRRAVPAPPRLSHALGLQLSRQADTVAARLDAGDGCGALAAARQLQAATIAAINARRVPPRLQESLLGGVNDLVDRVRCVPPTAPTASQTGQGAKAKHGKKEKKRKGKEKGD